MIVHPTLVIVHPTLVIVRPTLVIVELGNKLLMRPFSSLKALKESKGILTNLLKGVFLKKVLIAISYLVL